MREDMSRVIVERPRLGGDRGRKGRAVALDDLPKQEGMRRRHVLSGDCKMLNENLSPLRRYLERQVGRPWNKVYSEISRHLRADNTVQQHVRDHISDFVAVRPRRRKSALLALALGQEHYDRLWFEPLYVDLKDGLLKRTDRLPEAKRLHRAQKVPLAPPDRVPLSPERELRRIDGLWFEVTLAPLPEPEYREYRELRKIALKRYASRSLWIEMEMTVRRLASVDVFDVVSGCHVPLGPPIDEERAWAEYRRAYPDRRYAVGKRALARSELRRHGLSNQTT
jgi:hypothetical protein